MAERKQISPQTMRLLYVHSGNKCAFEGCNCPIFEDDGVLTGECCHIEAYSVKGPRYNEKQTDEDRNSYDNLVLMCRRHHVIIDSDPRKYTVEVLKKIKESHEKKYKADFFKVTDEMIKQLQKESEHYWSYLRRIEKDDETGFKVELNEKDIPEMMVEIDELYGNLLDLIKSMTVSSISLQGDLKKECEKCGIDYSAFNKIPYYDNCLVNRDWDTLNIGFPNISMKLELRSIQLLTKLLEEYTLYDQKYTSLLDKCKERLAELYKTTYYKD